MKTKSDGRRMITNSEIASRVRDLAPQFLDGLASNELAEVLGAGTPRRIKANSLIAIEGHPASKLFLMMEGRASTFTATQKGEKIVVFWILPGTITGARALLPKPSMYLLNTETVTDCLALEWNRRAFVALCRRYPRLFENTLQIASDYVETYRDLHVGMSHLTAAQRLAQVVHRMAKEAGRRCVGGMMIDITNEELANQGGITIFTVSRLLSDWRRRGLLTKSRGRIIVRSPEDLLRRVERDIA